MTAERDEVALADMLRLQRESWSSAAPGWDQWFASFEAFAGPLSLELARLSAIETGDSVLDVGCGNGEPSLTVARMVGVAGHVLGIDLAEPMVEFARQHAARAGVGQAEFLARDATDLSGLGPFDAAVSRFAIMLVPEPVAVARAVRSVLRPGARFAACVWGEGSEVPFCALAPSVVQRAFGLEPAAPDAPGPMRLGRPGALSEVLRAGGFSDVTEHAVRVEPRFASAAEGARFYTEGSGCARRALEGRTAQERERFVAEFERALAAHRTADGSIALPSTVRIARGTAS
ncbi:MAG: methyltransferase domain-containing protein [Planctomycetota bacterium]|nr:methyltransferase domain-containing protein [Planctomycetota bacterium]